LLQDTDGNAKEEEHGIDDDEEEGKADMGRLLDDVLDGRFARGSNSELRSQESSHGHSSEPHASGVRTAKRIIALIVGLQGAEASFARAMLELRTHVQGDATAQDGNSTVLSQPLAIRSRYRLGSSSMQQFTIVDICRAIVGSGRGPASGAREGGVHVTPVAPAPVNSMMRAIAADGMTGPALDSPPKVSVELVDHQLQVAAKEAVSGSGMIEIMHDGVVP